MLNIVQKSLFSFIVVCMHAKIKKYFLTVTLYKRESVIEHTFALFLHCHSEIVNTESIQGNMAYLDKEHRYEAGIKPK